VPFRHSPYFQVSDRLEVRVLKSGQSRELLTNYGKIDLLWFDGSWERTPQQWQAQELVEMIRSLQPEILQHVAPLWILL
jgi:alpha-L-fucosidase